MARKGETVLGNTVWTRKPYSIDLVEIKAKPTRNKWTGEIEYYFLHCPHGYTRSGKVKDTAAYCASDYAWKSRFKDLEKEYAEQLAKKAKKPKARKTRAKVLEPA